MNIKKTKTQVIKVADLHPNEGQLEAIGVHENPRLITDEEYQKLVNSLREDDLTGVLQLKVFDHEGQWVVLDGNMRLRALQEVGIEEVQCLVIPSDTDSRTLEKIIITSNSNFGQWDMDALANWDAPLADWGVDVPEIGDPSALLDEADFESLNDKARDDTGMEQITFLFQKEDAEKIKECCKVNGKQYFADKIVELCL